MDLYGTYLNQLDDLLQVGLLDILLAHLVELPCTGIAEFEPRTSLNAFFSQLQKSGRKCDDFLSLNNKTVSIL